MGREYASMKTEDRIQIVSWLIKLIMETLKKKKRKKPEKPEVP